MNPAPEPIDPPAVDRPDPRLAAALDDLRRAVAGARRTALRLYLVTFGQAVALRRVGMPPALVRAELLHACAGPGTPLDDAPTRPVIDAIDDALAGRPPRRRPRASWTDLSPITE